MTVWTPRSAQTAAARHRHGPAYGHVCPYCLQLWAPDDAPAKHTDPGTGSTCMDATGDWSMPVPMGPVARRIAGTTDELGARLRYDQECLMDVGRSRAFAAEQVQDLLDRVHQTISPRLRV